MVKGSTSLPFFHSDGKDPLISACILNRLIILDERQVKVMDSRDGHGRSCCTDRDDAEGRIQSVKTQADPADFTFAGISFLRI